MIEGEEGFDDVVLSILPVLAQLGVSSPELDIEVAHPDTGEVITVAEAFWSEGLQPGRGAPTVLDTDGTPATRGQLESLGYEVFTKPQSLVEYVERMHRIDSGEQESL